MANDSPQGDRHTSVPSKAPSTARRYNLRLLVGGFLLGTVLAIAVFLATLLLRGDRLPAIAQADLHAAMDRWDRHGPANYRLTLQLGGNRPGTVEVEVRDGEVVAMARDGRTPSQRRTWQYWSVPSQFDTIARDFQSAQDPARGFGAPPGSRTIFRGRFDPELGYPTEYERVVLGAQLDVRWQITRFETLP